MGKVPTQGGIESGGAGIIERVGPGGFSNFGRKMELNRNEGRYKILRNCNTSSAKVGTICKNLKKKQTSLGLNIRRGEPRVDW